jgi:hypothetical protein
VISGFRIAGRAGTVDGGNSGAGMDVLLMLLRATVAVLGAGRELISQEL